MPDVEISENSDQIRMQKYKLLEGEYGVHTYPDKFEVTHDLASLSGLEDDTQGVRIAGRLMTSRVMGKLTFATLQGFSGRGQIALKQDVLGKDVYKMYKKAFDIGDFVGCEGRIFTTKTGQKTLVVEALTFLGKAFRDLPEKFHGLTNQETIYRQRYLDLVMNEESLSRFKLRTKVIKTIRDYLDEHRFEEVETPILCNKASGAMAKPFTTHHNALDISLFLRIAPETYLKRLIAGGYERVYEFARCFRNEGIAPSHLQEFTMLEYYCAFWNYKDNMNFTERLLKHTIEKVTGGLVLEHGEHQIDFSGDWPRVTIQELIEKDCGIKLDEHESVEELRKVIREKGLHIDNLDSLGKGNLIDQLYKLVSRPKLIQPTFLISHPVELSPLARQNDDNPQICDRFQLVVNTWEVLNAYSELVDPWEQRKRLEEQAALRTGGDDEAMVMDEDYLLCMEHGMPPISGWGMGIERFMALITNQDNLKDTVLFPLMRPLKSEVE
tara:strand:+ start:376 stop:1863 length:1488 start_codon:yes stop_codon:yes gene_type:complete